MKNSAKLFGIIALAAVMTFAMTACSDGGGGSKTTTPPPPPDPQTVTYSGTAGGSTYTLKITEDAESRAVYSPQKGDKYELTVNTKKSTGTVTDTDGGLTLQPSETDAETFKVTVTENGGITAMEGKITWEGGETDDAPATLTPPATSTGGGISGTFKDMGNTLTFSNGTYTMTYSGGSEKGTYTVSGNTINLTCTESSDSPDWVGEKWTITIIDEKTLKDEWGTTWVRETTGGTM